MRGGIARDSHSPSVEYTYSSLVASLRCGIIADGWRIDKKKANYCLSGLCPLGSKGILYFLASLAQRI